MRRWTVARDGAPVVAKAARPVSAGLDLGGCAILGSEYRDRKAAHHMTTPEPTPEAEPPTDYPDSWKPAWAREERERPDTERQPGGQFRGV